MVLWIILGLNKIFKDFVSEYKQKGCLSISQKQAIINLIVKTTEM